MEKETERRYCKHVGKEEKMKEEKEEKIKEEKEGQLNKRKGVVRVRRGAKTLPLQLDLLLIADVVLPPR